MPAMKAKGVLSFGLLRDHRVVTAACVVCAVAYVVAHVCAVFTEAIHWDELLLFNRAEESIRTGVLNGGGRPGLIMFFVIVFVDGCDSVVTVTHQARLVWVVFTMLILVGVFELVRRAARGAEYAVIAAVLATAALALVPVFMRWSLHVRSDHPAVMLALWGGVALLASRNRAGWSLAGGVLLGAGYLSSQQALYITALVLLIAAGDMFIERRWWWSGG